MSRLQMQEVRYVYNQLHRSVVGGRYYFVAKAKVLPGGLREVIGKKVDVTASVKSLLLMEKRALRKPKKAKR